MIYIWLNSDHVCTILLFPHREPINFNKSETMLSCIRSSSLSNRQTSPVQLLFHRKNKVLFLVQDYDNSPD